MPEEAAAGHYGKKNFRRALIHFFVGKGIGGVVGIGWLLLLVRALPAADYGLYVGMVAFMELFNTWSTVGLAPISERYVPEYRQRNDEPALRALIVKLITLRGTIVVALACLSAALVPYIAPLLGIGAAGKVFVVFHVTLAVEAFLRYVETIFDSLLLQGRSQISLISRTALRLAGLLVALLWLDAVDLGTLVMLEAGAFAVGLVVTLLLVRRTLADLRHDRAVKVPLRPMLRLALPIYGSQLLGSLVSLDTVKILVLRTTDPAAAAIFGFCASLAWMLQRYLPSFLLVGMVRPLIVAAANDGSDGHRLRQITSLLLMMNGLILGALFAVSLAVADPLIVWLSHGKFVAGGRFFPFFVAYSMTQTLRTVYAHVALARGQGRSMLLGQLASLCVLGAAVSGAAWQGLYSYCVALAAIDMVWFAAVVTGWRAQLPPPPLPLRGLGRVALAAWIAAAIGAGVSWLAPAPIWGINASAQAALAVGLVYVTACVLLQPFTVPEIDAVVAALPARLRFLRLFLYQPFSHTCMLLLRALKKLIYGAEIRYRLMRVRQLAQQPTPFVADRRPFLVLLPPHPGNVFGSRGDQAMMLAAIAEFRRMHPDGRIAAITSPDASASVAVVPGVEAMPIWGKRSLVGAGAGALQGVTHFAVIGADVMDGYYWPMSVMRTVEISEQARLHGAAVGLLGFSFNASPNPFCVAALHAMHAEVRAMSRDPVSAERFGRLVQRPVTLVADAAFCMVARSSAATQAVAQWAAGQRTAGRTVVGFNLHLMLLDVHGACDEATAVQAAAAGLARLIEEHQAAVLLIPHDFRGPRNDKTMMANCLAQIPQHLRAQVLLPETEFVADELKTLTAACTVVLTGRMHLAIAALGMGVPVAAASYQGKFEGLLKHFNLPPSMIIQPHELGDPALVWRWMLAAFEQRAAMTEQVQLRWPSVRQLSAQNFAWMGAPVAPAAALADSV
jgi:polysaccharide pyruvyl transferase WcaK-like protein/O-antigen/teichoic acid export membrane protein